MPDETVADLKRAGFFRILQPQRWGGFELDPQTFFDVQIEVARACASSAWVLGVVGAHARQLALFDERAQREVWGRDDSALISSSYAPTGKGRASRGRLQDQWPLVVLERQRSLPVGVSRWFCAARSGGQAT